MPTIDLNLLRVFDTLIELRSVTRTAERLGVTQSAVSHSLARLREAMGDPLFVRGPDGLQPTARATQIASGVREGLHQLQQALSPSFFEPANARRRFTISAGSYFCTIFIPELLARVRDVSPGVSFSIVAPTPDLVAALDEGLVDIALGSFGRVPARLLRDPLFHEELVWIASANNRFAQDPPTLEDIADNPRLSIIIGRPAAGPAGFLLERGLERRVTASNSIDPDGARRGDGSNSSVYDVLTAAAIIARSDMVAVIPRRFAERLAERESLVLIEPVDDHENIDMAMLYHNKLSTDPGVTWLRQMVREVSASI